MRVQFFSAQNNELTGQQDRQTCFAVITYTLPIGAKHREYMLMNNKYKAQTLTGRPSEVSVAWYWRFKHFMQFWPIGALAVSGCLLINLNDSLRRHVAWSFDQDHWLKIIYNYWTCGHNMGERNGVHTDFGFTSMEMAATFFSQQCRNCIMLFKSKRCWKSYGKSGKSVRYPYLDWWLIVRLINGQTWM